MSEYSQGICEDGAAILCDGQPLTIEEILQRLRQRDELLAALKDAEKTLAHCKADIGYRHIQTDTAILINRVIAKCEAQS